MRNTFDFSPLLRSSIGFENLNRLVDFASRATDTDSAYPPYNIEKLDQDRYRITMAVAGFSEAELDITVQENALVISGKSTADANDKGRGFLHRGIARRDFERRFQLADVIKVVGASYENGLLNVDLVREIPEHKKPRKVQIGATSPTNGVIEGDRA